MDSRNHFYLVDHSLKNKGGHHADYASHLLRAAVDAGYRPVLATHRRFRGTMVPDIECPTEPLFRYHAYSRFAVSNGWDGGAVDMNGRVMRRASGHSRKRTIWSVIESRSRARRIKAFASACQTLFERHPPIAGDQVFLPTVSDFDVLGLGRYLVDLAGPMDVEWHLQFHFNFLTGRPAEFDAQQRSVSALRQQFQAVLERLTDHRVYLYTTTQQLADQYNRLGVADFVPLPYPINNAFCGLASSEYSLPLRVTSAGAVRPEKGQSFLTDLTSDLWDKYFQGRRLQLAVQCKPQRAKKTPRRVLQTPGEESSGRRFSQPQDVTDEPVVYLRHPLPPDGYRELIRSTDIGLLLYDGRSYFARHAGVLGEYLSAGIPVVVPAGCWLAEQIHGCQQEHLASLAPRAMHLRPMSVSGEAGVHSLRVPVNGSQAEMLLAFGPHESPRPGTYLAVDALQHDANGGEVAASRAIHSWDGRTTRILFHLAHGCETVEIRWSLAYDDPQQIQIATPAVSAIAGRRVDGGSLPASQVGLIAAGRDQVSGLLRELEAHYIHYRRSAQRFSREWHSRHQPERTLAGLLNCAASAALPRVGGPSFVNATNPGHFNSPRAMNG